MNGTANGTANGNGAAHGKIPFVGWLNGNLKLVMLALNGLAAVILLYFFLSQILFEWRTASLLRTVERIKTQTNQPPSEPSGEGSRVVVPRERGNRDRGSREAERPAPPAASAADLVKTTSATASTSGTTAEAKVPVPSPTSSTAATALAGGSAVTSGTKTTTGTVATDDLSAWMMLAQWEAGMAGGDRDRDQTAPGATASSGTASTTSPVSGAQSTSATAPHEDLSAWMMMAQFENMGGMMGGGRDFGGDQGPGGGDRGSRGFFGGRSGRGPGGEGGSRGGSEDPQKRELYAKLERRGLFGEPRPEVRFPQLDAILWGSALINGQWMKVGDRAGEYRVVDIQVSKVIVEDGDGKRTDVALMAAAGGGGGMPGMMPGGFDAMRSSRGERSSDSSSSDRSQSPSPAPTSQETPRIPDSIFERLTGRGGPFEGRSREDLMDRFRQMRERMMMGGPGGPFGRGFGGPGGSPFGMQPPSPGGSGNIPSLTPSTPERPSGPQPGNFSRGDRGSDRGGDRGSYGPGGMRGGSDRGSDRGSFGPGGMRGGQ